MALTKRLGIAALATGLALAVAGCGPSPDYMSHSQPESPKNDSRVLTGTVVKEYGTAKLLADGKSVQNGRDGLNLALDVQTPEGVYSLGVFECNKPLLPLAGRIHEGKTVVDFTVNSSNFSDFYHFSKDRIGRVPSDLIVVHDEVEK